MLTIPSIFGSYIYGHVVYGHVVDRCDATRSSSTPVLAWIGLLAILIGLPGKTAFWIVGFAIGLNFGGVPTAERPCCSVSSRTPKPVGTAA
jgi:hypothetical protein